MYKRALHHRLHHHHHHSERSIFSTLISHLPTCSRSTNLSPYIINHLKMFRLTSLCFIVVAVHSFHFIAAQSADKAQTCTSPSNIEDSCKAIGQKHPDITLDFCVSSLTAASKSMHSSDQHELAAATTRLAIAHAQSTQTKVNELMEVETDQKTKGCFSECNDVYNKAIDGMKDALDYISTQVYGKAVTHLRIARKAGDKCEEVFKSANISCPPAAVDQDYTKLANISLGLLLSWK